METVVRVVVGVQALRAFAYGFGAVILGSTLATQGLSDAEVGTVFTAMLAGMAVMSLAVARWSRQVERRRLYRALLAVMGLSGAVFALTTWVPALVLAALTGTMSTDANESGPITSLEQGMLGDAPPAARARVFGRYNAAAYLAGAAGSLLAGGPAVVRRALPSLPADQRWLLVFPVVALACVALAGRLPRSRPQARALEPRRVLADVRPGSVVQRLAALFALDAFAGGLVVQSFIVFWFSRRFGASVELMGGVLFAAGLLQAGSSLAAGWIAPRVGLVNTMVFTHVPSNLLLMAVAAMPSLGWAIAVLLSRSALSQMDVPARQAFIATIVDPAERTAAAAYTNTARYVARPTAPLLAGVLMQRVAVGAPFFAGGAIKLAYDALVFRGFRRALASPETGPTTLQELSAAVTDPHGDGAARGRSGNAGLQSNDGRP